MIRNLIDRIKGKIPRGTKRSSQWPKVRKAFLKEHPHCFACGGTKKLEVHHIKPFHLDPSKELDPTNLITLCEAKRYGVNCHLALGHVGNYKNENEDVVVDVAAWADKLAAAKATKALPSADEPAELEGAA